MLRADIHRWLLAGGMGVSIHDTPGVPPAEPVLDFLFVKAGTVFLSNRPWCVMEGQSVFLFRRGINLKLELGTFNTLN